MVEVERVDRAVPVAVVAVLLLLSGSALLLWEGLRVEPGPVREFAIERLKSDRSGSAAPGTSRETDWPAWLQLDAGSTQGQPAAYLDAAELVRFASLERGRRYSREELAAAADRLALHPVIRRAVVEQTAAAVVTIRVEERRCAAVVRNDEGDATRLYEVDIDLTILAENRVRCSDVPLIRGSFARENEDRMDRLEDAELARAVRGLDRLQQSAPELAARISELQLRSSGEATLYMKPARIRVELPAPFGEAATFQKLYAAVAYLEKQPDPGGVIDLRGEGVVVLPD